MNTELIAISEAAEFLKAHDNYLILSHANPDGDTLGCAFSLCGALQRMGKKAKNICADPISSRFDFMKEAIIEQDFEPETIISVDVADKRLLGDFEAVYGDKVALAVDHHVSHVGFAERLVLEPDAAACCQTVYKLIKELGVTMDEKLAACIYTGIATDSGCFKYASVSPETHIIAAELLQYNFGFDRINYIFFDMKTKERVALEETIFRSLEYYCEGKCAIVVLPKAVLDSVDTEDGNGIASIPRQIEGVEVGVVIKEKKDGWKASIRTNAYADAQKICKEFGGGGHEKAAGCSFKNMTPEEIKEKLIPVIEMELNK